MTADFLVERDGPTALLTFNRPDARNSMTFEMYEALHDACGALDADPSVRAVILKGAGDKAFASGTDIRQFLEFKTREDALEYEARLTRVLSRLAGMSKPTVAMLQGDPIGGGLFIALACESRAPEPGGSDRPGRSSGPLERRRDAPSARSRGHGSGRAPRRAG